MAMQNDTNRRIIGAVIQGARIYKAGDEAELAEAMRGKSMALLIEKKAIAGDWGSAPVAPAASTGDASDEGEEQEAAIAKTTGDDADASETKSTEEPKKPASRKRAAKTSRKRR